jgi:hypothetical protein
LEKDRLITIGEDKDEDKNFDTHKETSKGGLAVNIRK